MTKTTRAGAPRLRAALALVAVLAVVRPVAADGPPAAFQWPGGARVAVSLSYDDALPSQLDVALPALDARGLKASFYLTLASTTVAQRLPEWRQAAARGHELGNHTLFHPCSRSAAPGRDWLAPQHDLDRSRVARMHDEVRVANAFLHAIDGRHERTFTVPCGDLLAGGEPYLPALRPLFVGIKSRLGGITPDVTRQDPHDIGSAGPSAVDGAALVQLVQQAAAASGGRALVSITFHGIGGDHLAVSRQAHEQLLDHLAAHPERYWVAPFVDIMRHVRQAGAAGSAPGR